MRTWMTAFKVLKIWGGLTMNRFLLVTIMFCIGAYATPSPEPNRTESVQVVESSESVQVVESSESVQAMESSGDELQAQNNPAEKYEGIEDIEAPKVREIPAEMIPRLREPEPEIVCDRVVPTGSILPVKVCRRQSDISRKTVVCHWVRLSRRA